MSDEEKKKKKPSIPKRIVIWFQEAFEWVQDTLEDETIRREVYKDIGLALPEKGEPDPLAELKQRKDNKESLTSIERYQEQSDPGKVGFESAVNDLRVMGTAIQEIFDPFVDVGAGPPFLTLRFDGESGKAAAKEAAHRLFQLMTLNYLRLRYPIFYWLGQPLGVIEENLTTLGPGEAYPARIVNVLCAPLDHLKKAGWPPETEEQARSLTDATLGPLAVLLAYWEISLLLIPKLRRLKDKGIVTRDIVFGWDAAPNSTTPVADRIADRTLTFSFVVQTKEPEPGIQLDVEEARTDDRADQGHVTMTLVWVPTEHGGPGLLVALGGGAETEIPVSDEWRLLLKIDSASAVDFLIGDGVSVNGPADARAGFSLECLPDGSGLPHVFPDGKGTRLEFESIKFGGEISARGAGMSLALNKCAFVLCGGDGDGFIEKILPAGETRIDFNLVLGLATDRGFYIEGGTGLQALIPVSRSFGPLTLHHLHVGVLPATDPKPAKIDLELSAAMAVKLGPVIASVERIGLTATLTFPEGGAPDFTFDFKPPEGVGLAIDSCSVTGGGFLLFDPKKEEYAGIVQLELSRFTLKAVGMLTTRMPDGSRGFSLLLIIAGDSFKPGNLPIGFGFTLNGVGGLIGINRTVSVDVLRSGLRNGTLASVLFPPDPIRNAPQILSNLRSVFPPLSGQYIFGPMARIVWGSPTMLTIDLAIAMEFPSPTRLIVLGQFRALLPSKDQALVKLQMDALGVVDFDKGEASLDATLYDSRILQYTVSGDMALRARWEQDPTFLLAVGGFNPRFPAPAGFPTLKRVDINLTKGKNPRIRLEAYLALTSNTVQLGARADLFLGFSSFSVEGYLSFDALFQFSPFRFITDFSGGVTLKWRSYNLAGIHLKATLEGPSPWHIHGEAKFSVWIFDKTVTVDKTIGEEVKPELPPPVDPVPLLRQALNDKRNWITGLPAGGSMFVTLRQLPPSEEVMVHPLGELAVTQRVVPLNLDIAKFGNTKPKGAKRFTLDAVQFDGQAATDVGFTSEHFAPAEFLEMSDEEKLSRPSFEKLDAGIRIGTSETTFGDAVGQEMEYETIVIDDKDAESEVVEGTKVKAETFAVLASFGASRRSALRKTGRAKFLASESARGVTVRREAFVVASTDDLTVNANQPGSAAAGPQTFTEAQAALKTLIGRNPAERGRWQVVRRHVVRN